MMLTSHHHEWFLGTFLSLFNVILRSVCNCSLNCLTMSGRRSDGAGNTAPSFNILNRHMEGMAPMLVSLCYD